MGRAKDPPKQSYCCGQIGVSLPHCRALLQATRGHVAEGSRVSFRPTGSHVLGVAHSYALHAAMLQPMMSPAPRATPPRSQLTMDDTV